jgi:hypothetical protein
MSSFSTGLYGSTVSSIVGNINDAFSGKTSGIDVSTVVSELMQLQRHPRCNSRTSSRPSRTRSQR